MFKSVAELLKHFWTVSKTVISHLFFCTGWDASWTACIFARCPGFHAKV